LVLEIATGRTLRANASVQAVFYLLFMTPIMMDFVAVMEEGDMSYSLVVREKYLVEILKA